MMRLLASTMCCPVSFPSLQWSHRTCLTERRRMRRLGWKIQGPAYLLSGLFDLYMLWCCWCRLCIGFHWTGMKACSCRLALDKRSDSLVKPQSHVKWRALKTGLHAWATRGHHTIGYRSVAVEWKRSNDEFRHASFAYIENVLILLYEIVGVVGIGQIW